MPERTLHEQIKDQSPANVRKRFYLTDAPTASKYVGFVYPGFDGSRSPDEHYRFSADGLSRFVENLKDTFPDTRLEVDEHKKDPREADMVWDESITDPLFSNIRGRINALLNSPLVPRGLREIISRISLLQLKEQRQFNQNFMYGIGFMGHFDPKDERLMVLDKSGLGKITLTITPHRFYRRYMDGVSVFMAEKPGMRFLRSEPLPILLKIPNKETSNGTNAFQKILGLDTEPLRRVFPVL